MFGSTSELNDQSYDFQDEIIDSINRESHFKAIDEEWVFKQMKNIEKSEIATAKAEKVFEISGTDVLVASRIKNLSNGMSVLMKMIKPDYYEYNHRFFVNDKDLIVNGSLDLYSDDNYNSVELIITGNFYAHKLIVLSASSNVKNNIVVRNQVAVIGTNKVKANTITAPYVFSVDALRSL